MMKKLLALSLFVLIGLCATAQTRLNGAFDYAIFKTADEMPYLEAYIKLFGGSFAYKQNANGTYSGQIEITIAASSQGDKVDWYDKYLLKTGDIAAEDTGSMAIMDGKRFAVKEGKFRIDLMIRDLNSVTPNFIEYADTIEIAFNNSKPTFSTPVLVQKYYKTGNENAFSKSGYDMIPNATGFFDGEDSAMAFYTEIYGTPKYFGEGERFVVKYYVKNYETGVVVSGTEGMTASSVKTVYASLFPISLKNVGPGDYVLVVELRNKSNELVTSIERTFQRGGKINYRAIEDLSSVGTEFMERVQSKDSLIEFIRCLNPISKSQEQQFSRNVIKSDDKEMMKKYIVSFWLRKDPVNAEKAWLKYKGQVALAQKMFGTQYLRAFNTDRGRVFLQYGPPNVRSERPNEPFAYPYEIWQYYDMYNPITERRQTNRRFVFWNRDGASNNYELLHSDALGEQKNDRWEMVLYGRGKGTTDIDQTSPGQQNGGQSRDLFNSPR
jgi:GWxTD domain-containing protein